MSEPVDGYKLYNADNQLIGEGTGHVELQDGESVVYIENHAEDVDVQTIEQQMVAFDEIMLISAADRNFVAKYEAAKAYLEYRTENPAAEDAEPYTLIDPDLFPEIYDEFYYNYDLTSWTDIEFCQIIVQKHEAWLVTMRNQKSMIEARLRRKKLLAEQTLGMSTVAFLSGGGATADDAQS